MPHPTEAVLLDRLLDRGDTPAEAPLVHAVREILAQDRRPDAIAAELAREIVDAAPSGDVLSALCPGWRRAN